MFDSLVGFWNQLVYLLRYMTFSDVLDVILVAGIFFIIFQSLYQTRAMQLLRGVIILLILAGAMLVFLPLKTFDWLVRGLLLAGLISLPLLFQDELRRMLVRIGQFRWRREYIGSFDHFKQVILDSVSLLVLRQQGALIVLEGGTPLEDIIATGIRINAGHVTSELLQTIFHPKTPLHDGAVILRGDQLVAASAILPLQTESTGASHLGTRHRAALGLSTMVHDALVIVISEETGRISVAWDGYLHIDVSTDQLALWLNRFRDQLAGGGSPRWRWLLGGGLASSFTNLAVASVLACITWLGVAYQSNPPVQLTLPEVALVVTGITPGLLQVADLPDTVRVRVQSTNDRISNFDASGARAEVDLSGLNPGTYILPVAVTVADPFIRVLTVNPAYINVSLESEQTLILTPTVEITDQATLPPAYRLGEFSLLPSTIQVKGPRSQIQRISGARLEVALEGRLTDFQENLPVVLFDASGNPLAGFTSTPSRILVTIPVRRTSLARQVAVQAALDTDSLNPDYEIKAIEVDPPQVTLSGSSVALSQAGDFLLTSVISLTHVLNEISLDAPLILPPNTVAYNSQGEVISSVKVHVVLAPVTSYIVLEKTIQWTNLPTGLNLTLAPEKLSVLLIGPKPILDQIKIDENLVLVYVNLAGLAPGVSQLPVQANAPQQVQVQLFPSEIEVTLSP